MKRIWGPRVTTVSPRQGHYALDPGMLAGSPPADLAIAGIRDLLDYDLPALLGAATAVAATRSTVKDVEP
ncbi:MAG: hypothetical protein ABI837_08480 [Acidobacteriota bacterium]